MARHVDVAVRRWKGDGEREGWKDGVDALKRRPEKLRAKEDGTLER